MTWLLHNYFIPALNPTAPPPVKTPSLSPLTPLLTEYKNLLKLTTRDTSLRTQYKPEITKVLRNIERWIAEAKLAANVAGAIGWDDPRAEDEDEVDDGREVWALHRLSDFLLDKGGLVPVSKK